MERLESQIAAYATLIDAAAPPIEDLAPVGPLSSDVDPGSSVVPMRSKRRPPAWLAAGAAAAAVVVAVGSVAIITTLRSEDEVAVSTSTVPTTATGPTLTTVAALPPVRQTPVTLVSPDPVIGSETYDGSEPFTFFNVGDVALVDGTFHALLGGAGKTKALYHASSPDGSEWIVDTDPVVFSGLEDAIEVRTATLMRTEDGSWLAYVDVARDLGGFGNHIYKYWIYRATAPDITGPWTLSVEPVLTSGTDGSWDDNWVRNASVSRDGDQWTMFYLGDSVEGTKTGMNSNIQGLHQVGVATSEDGIVWEKREDPVFVGDPESAFEEGGISRIQVKVIGGEFLLSYAGRTGGNRGIATSVDGLAWVRDENNAVMTTIEVPRGSIFDTALVEDRGVIRWYAVAGGESGVAMYELVLEQ